MKLKKGLLYPFLALNVFFIFVLVGKIQNPTYKELNDAYLLVESLINDLEPMVIGEKTQRNEDLFFVERVIDGDTIVIKGGQSLRLIGIDASELSKKECFSIEATNENRRLVEGKTVRIEKDVSETDRYGRLLGYVWVDGIFINEYLVSQGYAVSYTYPPDVKYQDIILEAQTLAREEKRGLWGKCYPPSQKTSDVSPGMNAKQFSLRRDFAPDEAQGEDAPGVSPRELHLREFFQAF